MDIRGNAELQLGVLSSAPESLTEDVGRHPINRGGQPQQLRGLKAVAGDDLAQLRSSDGQRAGLVEEDRSRFT